MEAKPVDLRSLSNRGKGSVCVIKSTGNHVYFNDNMSEMQPNLIIVATKYDYNCQLLCVMSIETRNWHQTFVYIIVILPLDLSNKQDIIISLQGSLH